MSLPEIVSHKEWLAARKALLAREKEQTRARDVLNADRRRLPMVRVEKDYVFTGPGGPVRMIDLFDGRRQLVLQHVMFDPSWEAACPSCTAGIDELSAGLLRNLASRQTTFVAVSRTPYEKLARYRAERGWDFLSWYSSLGSDFNYDFHVTLDASVTPIQFNYRNADELQAAGFGWILDSPASEQPGVSCFVRDGDDVFHTYSTFGRGTEAMGGAYAILDLTVLGRQEDWEEPKGRATDAHPAVPNFADA